MAPIAEFALALDRACKLIAFLYNTMEAHYVEAGSMSIFWTQLGGTRPAARPVNW